ncbi:MAG: SBBP repeat-containing protein [Bryobacteraceae bacterium]
MGPRFLRRNPRWMVLGSTATVLFCADRPPQPPVSASGPAAEIAKAKVSQTYGKLPMSFEENRGQTNRRVKFLSHGQGYSMFLTSSGVVLRLQSLASPGEPGKHAAIGMGFSGAQPLSVRGEDQQAAKSSYFIGNDPAKWVTGAANYARVRYRQLYPGVDLVFYGNQGQLEYDLVVAPGADPRAIKLHFDGVDRLSLDSAGNLVLGAGTGEIRQHRPIVYQEREGVRQPVDGSYVIQSHNRVAFAVARYDTRKPLIIDPVLTFATYLGNNEIFGLSSATTTTTYPAVAVDFQGSVYLAGFNGGGTASFPGSPVTLLGQGQTSSDADVFVAKMNSTGTALLYSVVFGGSLTDVGGGIAVDASGNAYVTGFTSSIDFPTTLRVPQTILHGPTNAFVAEVNAAGNALVYCTYLGGTGNDWGRAIAVDRSGNAYVTGTAQELIGTTFPVTNGSSPTAGFLTEVNSTGSAFVYSIFVPAPAGMGYGVAVDSSGNAYVTGSTGTAISPAPAQAYVLKVAPGGGTAWGPVGFGTGGQQTIGFGIALDSQNNVYVTGMTNDPHFPQITGGAAQPTYGGGVSDAFAVELNAAGQFPPIYGTYIGGLGSGILPERGAGIGVDLEGYAYVAGTTQCINFPTTNAIAGARNGGPAVLMKGAVSGSNTTWSPTSLAGSFDQTTALAFDLNGTLYAGTSAVSVTAGGGIYKSSDGGNTWTAENNGILSTTIDAVAVDPNNSIDVYAIGNGQIYRSTNAGGSWTLLSQTAGVSGSLAIARTNPSTVYAGSSAGLIYSTNGGSSWNTTTVPVPVVSMSPYGYQLGVVVVVDPNNANIAYAGASSGGVFQTTNAGATWVPVNNFPGLTLPPIVTSLAISSTSTLYAATPNGLYYISNGGSSWTKAVLGSIGGTPLLVALDAANNVYVAFAGSGMATGTNGGTQPSDWSPFTYAGLTQNQVVALASQPGVSGVPFAGIISATDAFLTRISPGGGSFSFSTCIGGTDNDIGQNIAVTPAGTVYVSGATVSTDLPVTAGAIQPSLTGTQYGDFVARADNVPFVDVAPGTYYFDATNIMYEMGITNGCTSVPLEFCPNETNTRGEMAKFIVIAIEGSSNFTYNPTPYFSDVPPTNMFFSYIQKLYELGITDGCATSPSLMFCPASGVTRDQTAAFIIRARFASIPFNYPTTPYFVDVPPSDPFFSYVQEMYSLGVTTGCSTNPLMYCPLSILTRGEMADFIVRGLLNQLLPVTTPILTSVSPNSAVAGTPVTVTIYGMGTNFAAGITQVLTVPGITASNVAVSSPTRLTVQLTGQTGATPNPSPIVVATGTEQAGLPVGFTVN